MSWWHVLLAIAGSGGASGLGWWARGRWDRAGRELDALIEAETAELRAIPRVEPHEPRRPLLRLVFLPVPEPQLPLPPGPSPIFDQLAAEFERRVHPADEALAAALAAGAEFVAGLDSWADGARALIRRQG